MDFSVNVEYLDETHALIVLQGRLNAVHAADVKKRIKDSVAEKRNLIILDLNGVEFMDSSGLAALVTGLKATRDAAGYLRLLGANKQVLSVLKLTRLDRVFELYDDLDAARGES
jgi:anti-anti-sigma factor